MAKNCWLATLLTCLYVFTGWAEGAGTNTQYTVDVWDRDKDKELPHNSVISITQTRDGYLWMGTFGGLARFDGVSFTAYTEANTPGLTSSQIVKVFEDSRRRLWLGTESAGIFLVERGEVTPLALGQNTRPGRLMSICEDAFGGVWLYTADGQLARYRDGKIEQWLVVADRGSLCRSMCYDAEGVLWVGTDWMLYGLRPAANDPKGELPQAAYDKLPVPKLDFLVASSSRTNHPGTYWRLANGRIQKCKGATSDLSVDYAWDRWKTPVNAVCEDPEGNLVVGTGGEGVFWFDAQGHFVQLTSPASGLSHNTILSLCFDREGDLWVGTDGGGLNRVKPQLFSVLKDSLGSTVQSVCEGAHDDLWIGYNGERIDRWSRSEMEHYTRSDGLVNLGVKSVLADHNGRVWAGTYYGGLLQLTNFSRSSGKGYFTLAAGAESIPRDISALYQDRSNVLWVGTQRGLARWDGRDWRLFTTNGLPPNPIRALAQEPHGALWVGTDGGGLARLDASSLAASGPIRFELFGRKNGLPSESISCLYIDAEGVVWAGTSAGLARWTKGKWFSYAGRQDFATGSVGYLLEDGLGYLWLGAHAGLVRVQKAALSQLAVTGAGQLSADVTPASADTSNLLRVRTYGRPDGLPTRQCSEGSQPAACRTRDGKLWFPTTKGLVVVDPERLGRNTNPPPVLLESVLVDGQPQGGIGLRVPPPSKLTLAAGKESVEIHYASLNLSAPEQGLFRFQLAGHETVWTDVPGTTRSVRYTRLPPGDYVFHLTACNEDGVWNRDGTSLALTVLPPFWRTWWFLAGCALVLLASIVGSVHYISTQKLQRELAVMRQHEALERERARIARDLHDQLGANLTQVALLGEMAETDKDLPVEVEGHARQISQTARETTRALDEIVWTVNPSNDTLDGLVNYVCKYAQEYFALAGLRYRLEVPPELPSTPISPELRHNMFLAAKEAVNNVVKHSGAESAWFRMVLEPGRFSIEIEDNGCGLKAGDEKKGRSGLRNMRKRMEDVGGELHVSAGSEGGTRVRFTAPLPEG